MRIAVISGASSGIGLEFAKELDKMSFDELWLIAKDDGLLDNIKHILNTKTKLIPIDLSNSESFNEIKKLYEEESPEIEYLVCSAGVGFNGAFENITQKQIDLTVSINCTALSLLNSISLPFLTRGAKIINIASGSGFMPQPYFAVYAASKAYVISLSRALNYELKKNKISVTAVCPGPVNTSFFSSLENVKEYKKKFLITPQKVAMGALKAAGKRKTIYTPTFSMKLVHLASKILPTSLALKFYKE